MTLHWTVVHGPFNLTIFAYIIELYRNLPLAGDRERNNCVFLTQHEVGCIDKSRYLTPWKRGAGIAPLLLHLRLQVFCLPLLISDELVLKQRQPNICALAASSNKPAAWSVMRAEKARVCKMPGTHTRTCTCCVAARSRTNHWCLC